MQDIKKIIDSLEKTGVNYSKAKKKLAGWIEEVGFQEEAADAQKNLWEDLERQGNVPRPIVNSGNFLSQNILQQSEKVAMWVEDSQIDNCLFTAGTASEVMMGTTVSGASLSYPPGQLPPSCHNLEKIMSQRSQQEETSQKLRAIDKSLGDEYDNAWAGLHTATRDETRSPMFLIREVVMRLYHHYAPDEKVRGFHQLTSKDKIKRHHRIEYIASQIAPGRKQAFLDEEQAFLTICDELSKAHKHGELDIEETKGTLHLANGLIRLLLNSL